ncbi:hypothetical protein SELMODRAFT_416201 [Selaginella moellendorffii]|uniref:Serine-threonine/tyrosine-protein kinase catalytic domain-containing protein n=1 Tax=Selaginella moellendorffii TaxID=88036 RepID=D8RYE5_SELML|nr:hypothetical protein SELMODRAFT_416201 [Selaginella moellendorffii]
MEVGESQFYQKTQLQLAMLIHLSNKEQEFAELKASLSSMFLCFFRYKHNSTLDSCSRFETFVKASNTSVTHMKSCFGMSMISMKRLRAVANGTSWEVRILQNQVEQKDRQTDDTRTKRDSNAGSGELVAVKRIGAGSQQGDKVMSISSIHHLNLVKLSGFCLHSSLSLFVYEFLPKGWIAWIR